MIEFSPANIKFWSTIGSRASYGIAALELAKNIDDLVVITADTSTSAGLERFKKSFPEKYLDVGIAEQNMLGIAAGMASEGFCVFTSTFAPFQTMRCCEQIRMNLGYMQHKVTMVGLASGVALGSLGYSHCCLEDIGIIRSLGGITVISPADCTETMKAVFAAAVSSSPVYIRLTGGPKNPCVYTQDYEFAIGKAVTLRQGSDVTIIATGMMVHESLQAASLLEMQGISAAVIDMHTIAPLDSEAVREACRTTKLLVTVEEHSLIGGLGSAVAEAKAGIRHAPPQLALGFRQGGPIDSHYKVTLERHGLSAKQIAGRILEEVKNLS